MEKIKKQESKLIMNKKGHVIAERMMIRAKLIRDNWGTQEGISHLSDGDLNKD